MGIEIERKFLVRSDTWRAAISGRSRLAQGYLAVTEHLTLRVRIEDDAACLTIKGATSGIRRAEFEYSIPVADATAMLTQLAITATVEKTRHRVRNGADLWEIDVFAGDNAGLVVAEIELAREDQDFQRPDWLGAEVSDDPRYYNVNLARCPYRSW